jgi:hypothetical protein
MVDIFPPEVREAADKMKSDWIKASEFEGEGLTVQLAAPMARVKSQYGAEEGDFLVNQGILQEGETMEWSFTDIEGFNRKFHTTSSPFFIGLKQVEELGVGDWVRIQRTGKTDKTRYTVEKVPEPVSQRKEATDINPDDIPF